MCGIRRSHRSYWPNAGKWIDTGKGNRLRPDVTHLCPYKESDFDDDVDEPGHHDQWLGADVRFSDRPSLCDDHHEQNEQRLSVNMFCQISCWFDWRITDIRGLRFVCLLENKRQNYTSDRILIMSATVFSISYPCPSCANTILCKPTKKYDKQCIESDIVNRYVNKLRIFCEVNA